MLGVAVSRRPSWSRGLLLHERGNTIHVFVRHGDLIFASEIDYNTQYTIAVKVKILNITLKEE
jgi:hypothetical protein